MPSGGKALLKLEQRPATENEQTYSWLFSRHNTALPLSRSLLLLYLVVNNGGHTGGKEGLCISTALKAAMWPSAVKQTHGSRVETSVQDNSII